MKAKLKICIFASALTLTACSTPQPKTGMNNVGQEVVVASMNDESMPSWARKASERSLYEADGQVISVSMTTLSGDSRIDAGFKIGELNAKAALAKTLESRIESFTQLAEEGVDYSGQQLRSVTTEAAKITASNMRPGHRYYQKVAVTDDSGTPHTELRFWAEVSLSKENFRKAILDATRRATGKPTLSEAFARQVDKNFEHLLNSDSAKDERTPAKQDAE